MNDSSFHERPWGGYYIIDEGPGYLVKRLIIFPGHQTSLQRHSFRDEYWTVVSGFGTLVIRSAVNPVDVCLSLNSSVTELADARIEAKVWHRARCDGPEPLIIIEVWRGYTLSEDDIERMEDDYGRV